MFEQMTMERLRGRYAVGMIVAVAIFLVSSLVALAASSVVHDAKGDVESATESAHYFDPLVTPEDTARGYLDIKSVKVTKKNGKDQYAFSMTLGAPVPQDFAEEVCYHRVGPPFDKTTILVNDPPGLVNPGQCFFAWNWDLSDSDVFSGANQISPTVRWINNEFQGIAFTADPIPVFFDEFSVNGATITAVLDASEIESRVDVSDGFFFRGVTRNHRIDFGGDPLVGVADIAPIGTWSD